MDNEPIVIEPFLRGTFRVWDTPDGGLRIAYTPDGDDEKVFIIPGSMMKMAQMAAGSKNPLAALKGAFGGQRS